jgi:hypothetical protein
MVVCLILIAYLAGHLGQGVGNLMEKLPAVRRTLETNLPISADLTKLVHDAVAVRFGETARSLKPKELSLLCDQALICAGSPGEREIFVYREGFYRGNCVALAFLGLTLILRLVWSPSFLFVVHKSFELHRRELALAAIIAWLGSWLSFNRYLRFACHKNSTSLVRFLALAPTSGKENKSL